MLLKKVNKFFFPVRRKVWSFGNADASVQQDWDWLDEESRRSQNYVILVNFKSGKVIARISEIFNDLGEARLILTSQQTYCFDLTYWLQNPAFTALRWKRTSTTKHITNTEATSLVGLLGIFFSITSLTQTVRADTNVFKCNTSSDIFILNFVAAASSSSCNDVTHGHAANAQPVRSLCWPHVPWSLVSNNCSQECSFLELFCRR